MSQKTYQDLLKDPRWQKKRLQVLERDDWRCQCCLDNDKTLHVHHARYVGGNPWDCPIQYLITLCEKCHKEEEDLKKQDLYSLVDDYGITRYHLVLLMKHIRFRLDIASEHASPFWAFHNEVLRKIVPQEELADFSDYLSGR